MTIALLVAFTFALASLRRLLRRWQPRDTKIDELIAKNKATPRAEMQTVDWLVVNRQGHRRWQQTMRAQDRIASQ